MIPRFLQIESPLPNGTAETVVWLFIAAIIIGLYLVIRRTRAAARRQYTARKRHEEEMKRRDPDMHDPGEDR